MNSVPEMSTGFRRETPTTSHPAWEANSSMAAWPTSPEAPATSTFRVIATLPVIGGPSVRALAFEDRAGVVNEHLIDLLLADASLEEGGNNGIGDVVEVP